jgi:hypothetical protein
MLFFLGMCEPHGNDATRLVAQCPDQNDAPLANVSGGDETVFPIVAPEILDRDGPTGEHQPGIGEVQPSQLTATKVPNVVRHDCAGATGHGLGERRNALRCSALRFPLCAGLGHAAFFANRPWAISVSAICTAFSAAPLRRLSDTHQNDKPCSTVGSLRMRLTYTASSPAHSSWVT